MESTNLSWDILIYICQFKDSQTSPVTYLMKLLCFGYAHRETQFYGNIILNVIKSLWLYVARVDDAQKRTKCWHLCHDEMQRCTSHSEWNWMAKNWLRLERSLHIVSNIFVFKLLFFDICFIFNKIHSQIEKNNEKNDFC